MGFEKTKKLAPGESQNITINVDKESLKTYDSYNEKTYILEQGDYYLAVGTDSHDALNNILAKKGKTTVNGMDYIWMICILFVKIKMSWIPLSTAFVKKQ